MSLKRWARRWLTRREPTKAELDQLFTKLHAKYQKQPKKLAEGAWSLPNPDPAESHRLMAQRLRAAGYERDAANHERLADRYEKVRKDRK